MRRLLWLALAACTPERPQGDCLFWSDCGEGGACEYTAAVEGEIRFECSFADASCETGRRFGEFASSERANQCVEFASGVGGICDEAHDCGEGTDCRLGRCVNVKELDATQNAFAALCSDHLRDGGDVYLWGFALDVLPSQIGIGVTFDAAPLTAAHMTMPGFPVIDTTSMTMGDNHFCSIGTTAAGDYSFCFGRDGGPMGPDLAVGVDPDGVGSVFGKDNPFGLHTLLSAGITHTCGLRAGTTQLVDCWGENGDRQLDGTASDVAESTVSLGNRVGDVTTGPNFTCAGTAAGVTC